MSDAGTIERHPHYVEGLTLSVKTRRALSETDVMTPGLRQCVHEFGFAIVTACVESGVTEPAKIRHLVFEIWQGARHGQQKSNGQPGAKPLNFLDWVLTQAGAQINAARLLRVLWQQGFVIVPREPSPIMDTASMDAIKTLGLLTKQKKHHVRLRAAIMAATKHLWPHLLDKDA